MSDNARAVAVGDVVYILAEDDSHRPGGNGGFIEYDLSTDAWRELPAPAPGQFHLTRFGETVLAYRDSDENGEQPDLIFNPATSGWDSLPADPLSPSFDRTIVEVNGDLYLFAADLDAQPDSESPSLVKAAMFNPDRAQWATRTDSEILGSWSPTAVGDQVIFPNPGTADGGQVNNWGRDYPYGGIYDTPNDSWEPLPPPASRDDFVIAGVLDKREASYTSVVGSVLSVKDDSWVRIPAPPFYTPSLAGHSVVAAGTSLFVIGGEDWENHTNANLLDKAYTWTPNP